MKANDWSPDQKMSNLALNVEHIICRTVYFVQTKIYLKRLIASDCLMNNGLESFIAAGINKTNPMRKCCFLYWNRGLINIFNLRETYFYRRKKRFELNYSSINNWYARHWSKILGFGHGPFANNFNSKRKIFT